MLRKDYRGMQASIWTKIELSKVSEPLKFGIREDAKILPTLSCFGYSIEPNGGAVFADRGFEVH